MVCPTNPFINQASTRSVQCVPFAQTLPRRAQPRKVERWAREGRRKTSAPEMVSSSPLRRTDKQSVVAQSAAKRRGCARHRRCRNEAQHITARLGRAAPNNTRLPEVQHEHCPLDGAGTAILSPTNGTKKPGSRG